ncbi:MAG TPA: PKD domain-containing protein, partial [Flavobacteriales bacterium]|nr:PKD domain-containing protein [Flavobacteriales bacterium]
LEDLSIGATNLAWDLGDGQTVNGGPGNVSHTYSNTSSDPVLYDPVLIASTIHGCSDTATSQIEVFPPITAVFSIDTVVCSPFISNIINSSVGAVNYLWTMGDGVILAEQNPIHTYVNSTNSIQTRVITLTTTSAYGCTATSSVTIQVHPVPNAALQATPFTQQFPNATVNFANNSAAGAWTYLWNLDDGTTFNTQTITAHTYSTWGTYQVSLIVSSAICSDTAIQEVVILPPLPTANFIGSGEGCVPLTVDFTNTSWQGLTYLWQFGDGSTSSADDPIYTFNVPGTYTVTLTAYGQGGMTSLATKVDSVIVHPKATAFFVSQPEEVVVPSETVYFYNLSSNATDYSWQFGDGVISTDMNPEHNYLDPGTYDVVMIANNQWNCPDTFTVIGAVTGEAAGDLQFPNAFTPALDGPTNGEYDPRSFENHFFFPLHSGVEQFDLKIYDRWGELIFATTDIMIGWDGYYRGEPAKQDVYVWKAFAKFSDGRETVQKGDLTLLR